MPSDFHGSRRRDFTRGRIPRIMGGFTLDFSPDAFASCLLEIIATKWHLHTLTGNFSPRL